MNLTDLFKTRAALAEELSRKRAAIIEAERGVSLCEKLERDIPRHIENLIAVEFAPGLRSAAALEDFNQRHELTRNEEAVMALQRLGSDIKEIRAHYVSRLAALTV